MSIHGNPVMGFGVGILVFTLFLFIWKIKMKWKSHTMYTYNPLYRNYLKKVPHRFSIAILWLNLQ